MLHAARWIKRRGTTKHVSARNQLNGGEPDTLARVTAQDDSDVYKDPGRHKEALWKRRNGGLAASQLGMTVISP